MCNTRLVGLGSLSVLSVEGGKQALDSVTNGFNVERILTADSTDFRWVS